MCLSWSLDGSFLCPICHQAQNVTIWLLVDPGASPHLLDGLARGQLHDSVCPQCGFLGSVKAPLVVVTPWLETPLWYSPPHEPGENWARLNFWLLAHLYSVGPGTWLDDWLPRLGKVSRKEIAGIVQQAQRTQSIHPAPHDVRGPEPAAEPTDLLLAWEDYARGTTLSDLVREIKRHPILIAQESAALLARFQASARIMDLDRMAASWHPLLRFLEQCRLLGVTGAEIEAFAASPDLTGRDRLLAEALLAVDPIRREALWDALQSDQLAGQAQLGALLQHAILSTARAPDGVPNIAGAPDDLARWVYVIMEVSYYLQEHPTAEAAQGLVQMIHLVGSDPRLPMLESEPRTRIAFYLGSGFLAAFGATQQPEHAIAAAQWLSPRAGETAIPPRAALASALLAGYTLVNLARTTDQQEHAEQALNMAQWLRPRVSDDDPMLPGVLALEGLALLERDRIEGGSQNRDLGIQSLRLAIDGIDALDDPVGILKYLGRTLVSRHQDSRSPRDLQEAVAHYRSAYTLAQARAGRSAADVGSELGQALLFLYGQTCSREILVEAFELLWKTPENSLELDEKQRVLRSLRAALDRCDDLGDWDFVPQAKTIIEWPELGAGDRAAWIHLLGVRHFRHYESTGGLAELDEAINYYQRATEGAPRADPRLPLYLENLNVGLIARFDAVQDPEDVARALDVARRAGALLAEDSADRGERARNQIAQAASLLYQSDIAADQNQLNESIELFERALRDEQFADLERIQASGLLARALTRRYELEERENDAVRAAALLCQARDSQNPDSPTWYRLTGEWAQLASRRAAIAGREEDAREATAAFRAVCRPEAPVSAEAAMAFGILWGQFAFQRRAWGEAAEAYTGALATFDRIYAYQILDSQREDRLQTLRTVFAWAAYALARTGPQGTREAVFVLERSRARLASDSLARARGELSAIREALPEVVERYELASRQLSYLGRSNTSKTASEDLASASRALAAAVAEIRAGGFSNFDDGPSWEAIDAVLRDGEPLVYLVVTDEGSVALVLEKTRAEAVWLDGMTANDLVKLGVGDEDGANTMGLLAAQLDGRASVLHASLVHVLPALGATLMEPLSRALRTRRIESIVLVPTGVLGLFPLHAASWWIDGVEHHFLDEVAVSYVPSARLLAHARATLEQRIGAPARLAAVGNPTPSSPPLLQAESEVQSIAALFGDHNATVLLGEKATRDALLDAAANATHVHLACHGTFDANEPLNSVLLLAAGERLTLREIRYIGDRSPFGAARLVVLSACETGITQFHHRVDEALGFPLAFLHAGTPACIGTLWPISDFATSLLMVKFYEQHMGQHLSPSNALRATQMWLRSANPEELRSMAMAHHLSVASLTGFSPGDAPLSSPFYWAAFTVSGAAD